MTDRVTPAVLPDTGAQPTDALWRLKVVYAASSGGIGTFMPYVALYLTWRGLSPSALGVVLGLMAATGVLAVPL